jgi:hypothetical protein
MRGIKLEVSSVLLQPLGLTAQDVELLFALKAVGWTYVMSPAIGGFCRGRE